MGKDYNKLSDKLQSFIAQQKLYFIATASASISAADQQTFIAPKGYQTLKIVDSNQILCLDDYADADYTAQHLAAAGRVSVLWAGMTAKPCNLWVYGQAEVIGPEQPGFANLLVSHFAHYPQASVRHVIRINIQRAMTACGFSVPLMDLVKDRPTPEQSYADTEQTFTGFTDATKEFARQQKMFFVGTAPSGAGEIHAAPKGYNDSFKIISDQQVAYLDYYGSENNTAQHLTQNGQICFMWCAFGENPQILRLCGHGQVIAKGTSAFDDLLALHFATYHPAMVRQIFLVDIAKLTSGFAHTLPIMNYVGERKTLHDMSYKMLVKNPAGKLFAKFFNTKLEV